MEQAALRAQDRWDQVANNFDLLFARVDDILGSQIKLEAQYDMTTKVVEQMMKDQQVLAQQIELTGQAVARLTLNSTRPPVGEPPSPTISDASTDNPFHQGPQGTSHTAPHQRQDRGVHRGGLDGTHRLKHAIPKLAFPRFTGSNPRVWRSKCQDYFQLYNVPPAMQPRLLLSIWMTTLGNGCKYLKGSMASLIGNRSFLRWRKNLGLLTTGMLWGNFLS